MKRCFLLWSFALSLLLLGCGEGQIFEDPAARATRQAQGTLYVETAAYAQVQYPTLQALQATVTYVPIMETQSIQLERQNVSLRATLDALATARPDLVIEASPTSNQPAANVPSLPEGGGTAGTDPSARGQDSYRDVTTASNIDSNRCAAPPNDTFYINGPNDPTVIYFTVVALDVPAGTRYEARWYKNSRLRSTSTTWTADQDYEQICLAYELRSSDTPYENGFWQVELRSNGFVVTQTRFAMCVEGELC